LSAGILTKITLLYPRALPSSVSAGWRSDPRSESTLYATAGSRLLGRSPADASHDHRRSPRLELHGPGYSKVILVRMPRQLGEVRRFDCVIDFGQWRPVVHQRLIGMDAKKMGTRSQNAVAQKLAGT